MSGPPPSFPQPPAPLGERPELPAGVDRPPLPRPGRRRREGLPEWPAWSPLAAILMTLVIALIGALLIAVVASLAGVDVDSGDEPPGVLIGATFLQDFALVASAVVLARILGGRPTAAQFGLRSTRAWPAVGWTVLAWVTFIAFSALWALVLGINENDDLPEELGADDSTTALVFVALLVALLAPLAEEFFFRGFCFTALRGWIGMLPAALLTGVIFGGIHAGGTDVEFLVPLAVFGFLLCLLYWRTGSIIPGMVLHALNNALALGVSLDWTAGAVVATMAGATAVILALTLPLARVQPKAAA